MDYSLPGSSLHGILQARVLKWVAISFSRGSSQPRDWTQVSCIPGRHFNLWATREAPLPLSPPYSICLFLSDFILVWYSFRFIHVAATVSFIIFCGWVIHIYIYIYIYIHCCCCSVAQSCPALCNPMDCSTPGLPVSHHLLKFAQAPVHCSGDAIQPSHPLIPSSPCALNLSQHQRLFQWVSCLHQMTKILDLQLQHQSFQCVFRVDFP